VAALDFNAPKSNVIAEEVPELRPDYEPQLFSTCLRGENVYANSCRRCAARAMR